MTIESLEQKVKSYWVHTPAVVIVKEIIRRSQLPKWEDCPKDHIFVGVSRRKSGDKVTVVKHQIEGIYGLNCKVERLIDDDMTTIGVKPTRTSMCCFKCGEFSTRINIDGSCQDCNAEAKKK